MTFPKRKSRFFYREGVPESMSDSLSYQQCREIKTEAEQLLKAQKYAEAALLYKQAYDLCKDDFAASKYLFCSRRIGVAEAREALKLGQQAQSVTPSSARADCES
jgi:hypothetical protein